MNLAIFDIDGTLAHTDRVYDPFFFAALARQAGSEAIHRELDGWRHVTDQGIVEEALVAHRGTVRREDVEAVKGSYLAAMRRHEARARAVPGAAAALEYLGGRDDWRLAIATGNWTVAAHLKLERAGLRIDGIPVVGCDDTPSRTAVMERAHALAATTHGCMFERVVYVGDAKWDVIASRELGWPFVGIGTPRSRLLDLGASHVLDDLSDVGALMEALDAAVPP